MRRISFWAAALSTTVAITIASSVRAQMPMSYQGFLTDAGGAPITGTRNFSFAIYDTVVGGTALWSQAHFNVAVTNGIFEVVLDIGSGLNLTIGKDWLGTRVAVPGNPFDPELTPRTRLAGAPYCYRAIYVDRPDIYTGWIIQGQNLYTDLTGNVGIGGFSSPQEKLHVRSDGPAKLFLEADRDNAVSESDNAAIRLSQDGGQVTARVGYRDGRNQMEFINEFSDDLLFGTGNLYQMVLSNAGELDIRDAALNFRSVLLGPSVAGNPGGKLVVYDDATHATFEVDGEDATNDGSVMTMREVDGTATIELDASEAGGGGDITIRKGDGTAGIELDANYAGSGSSRVVADVLQITGGADLSEQFTVRDAAGNAALPSVSDESLHQGFVVSIDPDHPGELKVSDRAYDSRVAGVVSGAGQVRPGMLMGQAGTVASGDRPVALTGRVYCWADASGASIQPGDLLTSSDVPGHAMKATDHGKAQGAIIGKAMTKLEKGRGLVLVLVNLQ